MNGDEKYKLETLLGKQKQLLDKLGIPYVDPSIQINGNEFLKEVNKSGLWVERMINCMNSELEELRNCLYWKHWAAEFKTNKHLTFKDYGNAKIEAIDLLHFMLCIFIFLGMDSNDIFELYSGKHKVNIKRQDTSYAQDTKTEDDNKELINKTVADFQEKMKKW